MSVIKSGLSDFKDDIEKMTKKEKEIEKPHEIVDIAEKILDFNQLIKKGQGQKTLTPDQMLNRLPISLAQLNARNNSEKLKNEIRLILYSLYRSKRLTKKVYKSLIDTI